MPTTDRPIVTLSENDIATIRALRDETKTSVHPGVMTVKNAETFPELFGSKRFGGGIRDDGVYWTNAEGTMRYVRAKERHFVGTKKFPDGIVIGTTDIETHRVDGGDEWAIRNSQWDISPDEFQRIECMVMGIPYLTQKAHAEITKEKEAQRQAARRAAVNPIETAAAAGAAAALAASRQVGPTPEQLAKAGFRFDPATQQLVKAS